MRLFFYIKFTILILIAFYIYFIAFAANKIGTLIMQDVKGYNRVFCHVDYTSYKGTPF